MNHSGNEHLSSGSPQAGVLTKDFAPNIWYTLYFSTGQGCWNTAHVMDCFTESDTGGKRVFVLHVRKWVGAITQHKPAGECKWLHGQGTTEVCSEADSILSPSQILEFMLLICVLFNKKEKNIIRGSLRAITRLGQPLRTRLSDKVHCIYLCLLLFFCLDSIKRCTKAITAVLAPTCWYKILIGHYHLKRAIKVE